MPELPDVIIYLERLTALIAGRALERVRIASPFVLQTFDPPIRDAAGRRVLGLRRIGKRIVWEMDGDLFLVFHLMIAGRFHLRKPGAAFPRRTTLAAFDFPGHLLLLTEASTKKRATIHLVKGEVGLAPFHRGGLEVLEAGREEFVAALTRENHTLKRALADPSLFSGVGNAYSDEILHAARLSPLKLTRRLSAEEADRLYAATRQTLSDWIDRLRRETGDGFPEKVTAFRKEMAVHGRFGQPCSACGSPVQRIVYAENQANYCPTCQTGGRLLADRALSRLLRQDWPRTLEDLEEMTARAAGGAPTTSPAADGTPAASRAAGAAPARADRRPKSRRT